MRVVPLLLAMACDVPWRGAAPVVPATALPLSIHRCGPYHRSSGAFSFCVYKQAEGLASADEVAEICPLAADLEGECRRAWVAAHVGTALDADALIAVCGSNDDCVLEVLDARADPDLAVQVARCDEKGGPFAGDCVVHAAERWARARPDAAEVARIAALATAWPDRLGYALATVVTCQGTGRCTGDPDAQRACEETVARILQEPSLCVGHGASGDRGTGP